MSALPPRFSPDGNWFWTGTEWRSALSQDRLWRWNGYQWVPNQARTTSTGAAVGITVGVVAGALAVVGVVSLITIVVLLTMGHQIANVFSNVVAALGSSPSP